MENCSESGRLWIRVERVGVTDDITRQWKRGQRRDSRRSDLKCISFAEACLVDFSTVLE